ncbi:hypothetical protein EVAR_63786_1 [Eumeta japonica]|uniref:Uncharacterized protein n=1 Tax=Eumeta variegata TaxID=151549 RepID=A0A4C1ZHH7_EUMVA|nr:hypothetical protein EVAR_63786_1 [Eumeta japonica]
MLKSAWELRPYSYASQREDSREVTNSPRDRFCSAFYLPPFAPGRTCKFFAYNLLPQLYHGRNALYEHARLAPSLFYSEAKYKRDRNAKFAVLARPMVQGGRRAAGAGAGPPPFACGPPAARRTPPAQTDKDRHRAERYAANPCSLIFNSLIKYFHVIGKRSRDVNRDE